MSSLEEKASPQPPSIPQNSGQHQIPHTQSTARSKESSPHTSSNRSSSKKQQGPSTPIPQAMPGPSPDYNMAMR